MYDHAESTGILGSYEDLDLSKLRLLDKIDTLQTNVTQWKSVASGLYQTCLEIVGPIKTQSMMLYEETVRESH